MKAGAKEKTTGALPLLPARKSAAKVLRKLFGREDDSATLDAGEAGRIDPVIHERTRLAILTALFTLDGAACSFSGLRETLSLTDGNLMAHLRTLEEAGLVERIKEGAGRKSSTTVQLSLLGKKAFTHYLNRLELLVRAARGQQE